MQFLRGGYDPVLSMRIELIRVNKHFSSDKELELDACVACTVPKTIYL